MSLNPREQLASATMIATHEVVTNLAKAKTALESLVHGMQDLTCLVTLRGRIVWGNVTTATWLGLPHDTLHTADIGKLFSDEDHSLLLEKFLECPADDKDEFQMKALINAVERDVFWSLKRFETLSTRRGPVLLLVGRDITEVLKEKTERVKLETELETAQLMQQAFFPQKNIQGENLEICSYYRPAEQCSGDWWGYFPVGQDVELVCIADVTGHGAASALVTAMTQATCMNFAARMRKRAAGEAIRPSALMDEINQVVCETFKGDFFMTFFCIAFDHSRGVALAVNAAHNFPMVMPRSYRENPPPNEPGRLNRFPETLLVLGNPIGFELASRYEEKEFTFEGGDRFILYTDGIVECRDNRKRMYGVGSFRRSITRHDALSGEDFRDALVDDALRFYGDQPLSDDLTLVTVDVKRR